MSAHLGPDTDLFLTAHRDEFKLVKTCVERSLEGSGRFFLLDFYSPDGFGKTALIDHIWQDCEATLAVGLIRAQRFVNDSSCDRRGLLRRIDQEVSERLARRALRDIYTPAEDADELEWVTRIVALAKAAANMRQVTLLLFDDFDALPENDRRWLEKSLFGPLGAIALAGLVLTTKKEVRLERIDLRARLQSVALSGLTVADVESSFPQFRAIAPQLQDMTGGLPALTSVLVHELVSSNVNSSEDFIQLRLELMQKYYSSHVLQHVLSRAPDGLQDTIQILALLRVIDVPTLRSILPQVLADQYREYTALQYVELLAALGSWVQWRSQGNYEVNPAFASILRGYVLIEKPRLYRTVHQSVLNYYLLLLNGGYQEPHLVESLYHRLMLLQHENHRDHAMLQDEVSGSLRSYLERMRANPGVIDFDSLRNTLEHDPDLKTYISSSTFDYIQEQAAQNLRALGMGDDSAADPKVRSIQSRRSAG